MGALFSGDIDSSHYRPPQPIDLTRFDQEIPVVDPQSGDVINYDWDMPDAMIVNFPKEKKAVAAWRKNHFIVQFRHLINRDD